MAKINPRKIKDADYPKEYQDLIQKLGRVLNPFFDEIEAAFRKGFTVEENLPSAYRQIEVAVDSSGIPTSPISLTNPLNGQFQGFNVLNVIDLNGTAIRPTAAPFISFEINGTAISIKHIAGLPATSRFRLFLELKA